MKTCRRFQISLLYLFTPTFTTLCRRPASQCYGGSDRPPLSQCGGHSSFLPLCPSAVPATVVTTDLSRHRSDAPAWKCPSNNGGRPPTRRWGGGLVSYQETIGLARLRHRPGKIQSEHSLVRSMVGLWPMAWSNPFNAGGGCRRGIITCGITQHTQSLNTH